MRSNDAYLGLPHDIFAFTMLQEMIARSLGVDVGFYQHIVGHLHLYDEDIKSAQAYLSEGFQSILPMPPLPMEDPWPARPVLLRAETAIRADPQCTLEANFDPYWEDILRLLRVYSENHHKIQGYKDRIEKIRTEMSSNVYDVYIA
jgi:thymidylate synthase